MILRIVGYERGVLKIHYTRYLKEGIGMGLKAAKTITDDMLEGKICEIEVPDDRAELHTTTLRLFSHSFLCISRVRPATPIETSFTEMAKALSA